MPSTTADSTTSPVILSDPARLIEVFQLRPLAWEHSPDGDMVNTALYPSGWSDELDATGTHWILDNTAGQVIASARMNVLSDLKALAPAHLSTASDYFITTPFAYISRLVVHPNYRGLGLARRFDMARIQYAQQAGLRTMVVLAGNPGLARFRNLGFVAKCTFVNSTYKHNPRNAPSHLMSLALNSVPIQEELAC